ncbi:short-chain dehydrogenase/reductase [Streptomyces sp. NPDC058374]|uniref:short-chain dehydrogenase/reductase n=1 Tax=unclassified Streptomyces TaxID=2593676 RepID=UPI003652E7E4
MDNSSPLRDRTVVVTGAARGIGEETARELVRRGARVALLGLEEERLERLAADLPPGSARPWPVDVADEEALTRAAAEIRGRWGAPSVVVANAGVAAGGPFAASDPQSWRRIVEANLVGSVLTARCFLPDLLATRGYHLQVASLAALAPSPMLAAYSATKAGAEAFARSLGAEVAHRGVRVGVAYLSWTDTGMIRAADRTAALRLVRSRLPWPATRTHEPAAVARRLVDGMERRASSVYAPAWLRAVMVSRGLLPPLITQGARWRLSRSRVAGELEGTGLLGPGGEAYEARRGERHSDG